MHTKINRAWYGLKQSSQIAYLDLCKRLEADGYKKVPLDDGYFYHKTRDISFTLVVDDFLIKYKRDKDLAHLNQTILKHYTGFKIDTEAKQYIGLALKWDYAVLVTYWYTSY